LLSLALVKKLAAVVGGLNNGAPPSLSRTVGRNRKTAHAMIDNSEQCRMLVDQFLNRWSKKNLADMTIEDYVSINDKDTFCQWVETKTEDIGKIKSPLGSIKFGIYKRKRTEATEDKHKNDDRYTWLKQYSSSNSEDAFVKIKNEILGIVESSLKGDFRKIDNYKLYDIFKWKVAFLFSHERLIPIFSKEVLIKICSSYGYNSTKRTPTSELYENIISRKPIGMNVYEYGNSLWQEFGKRKQQSASTNTKKDGRSEAISKNTDSQARTVNTTYIATQKHNLIQNKLYDILVAEHGKNSVFLEKDFVDIKVILLDRILLYEVKSDSYAEVCVRNALGQIINYCFKEKTGKLFELIVVGQYKPVDSEIEFVNFIKSNLNIKFDYQWLSIE
jgi:hypothetical protein